MASAALSFFNAVQGRSQLPPNILHKQIFGQYRREVFIFPEELVSSPGSVWDGELLHPGMFQDIFFI
jgi:hypothetical protein